MKKHTLWACLLAAPVMVGCSDINLSDVDTNISVPVNELTIPVNIDQVKLSTMLDVSDDGKLRLIGGQYAVVVEGDYKSQNIHIDPIKVKSEPVSSITGMMKKQHPSTLNAPAASHRVDAANPKAVAEYVLPIAQSLISAYTKQIDEAIEKLKNVKTETDFNFDLNLDNDGSLFKVVKSLHVKNLQVQVPRGIIGTVSIVDRNGTSYVANYDSKTGLVNFNGQNIVSTDGVLHLKGHITGFDANLLDQAFHNIAGSKAPAQRAAGDKEFKVEEYLGVKSGSIVLYDTDFRDSSGTIEDMYNRLTGTAVFHTTGKMEDIVINTVSGSFDYEAAEFQMKDIYLGDIPGVLRQSGTDIRLDNPQLYVSLNNPIVDGRGRSLMASTDFNLVAKDRQGVTHTYTLDRGQKLEANTADNNYYLSPKAVDKSCIYPGFGTPKHVGFAALSDVLSDVAGLGSSSIDDNAGSGMPLSISLKTFDTHISGEDLQDFPLGRDYVITGRYAFVAPLALSPDSRLKYTYSDTGWQENTKGIAISKLTLDANVSTDVPFELQLRVVPLNTAGEPMSGTFSTVVVPANAKSEHINLVIEGDIRDLDGVKFDALVTAKDNHALTPDMNITIDGIKVKVSGKYEEEL